MINYLSKRGTRYYFRRKIPLELRVHFGKAEIVVSLGTSDRDEAIARCRVKAVVHDGLFAALSRRLPIPAGQGVQLQEDSAVGQQKLESDRWLEARELGELEQAELDYQYNYQTEEQEHAAHDRFEALVEAEMQRLFARREAYRRMGESDLVRVPVAIPATTQAATPIRSETLREVVPSWTARNKAKDNAISRTHKAIELFEKAVGSVPLQTLTKAHGATFVRFLLDEEARGFKRKTASNYAGCITALLNVAVKDDLIARNPFDLSFDKTIGAEKRTPWSAGELRLMYSHALFSNEMDRVPSWHGVTPADGRALLLILQHTGARIGEIAQLRRRDFRVLDGITVLDITAEAGTVKTKESERTVPLAAHLLADSWFAVWLKAILDGTSPDAPALPSMSSRARGPADAAGQWFRHFRANAGFPDGALNGAHRFRHWIRSEMAARDVRTETADAITGHAAQGSSGRIVYTTITAPVMLAALNRLSYPKITTGRVAAPTEFNPDE